MKKRKSIWVLFAIFGLSIIILSQCTGTVGEKKTPSSADGENGVGKNDKSKANNDNKTLKVIVSLKTAEVAQLQTQSTVFMLAHPGVTVSIENVARSELYTKLKTASQLGDVMDVMLMDNEWVNEFAALGYLHPTDDYFTGEQQLLGVTQLMNQMKWNGYIWGVPKDLDPYILVWNKKTAAENKLEGTPSTPEQLATWNKVMMHPEEGKYGVYVNPTDPYAFLSLISIFGKINEPTSLKLLESFYHPQEGGWNVKNLVKNYPTPSVSWNPWDLLIKGKMAAMVTQVSEFKLHQSNGLVLAALPVKKTAGGSNTEVTNGGLLGGRSYTISSHSANRALAMSWIKEMTSVDNELKNWNDTKILPAMVTALTAVSIQNDENYKSFVWLIETGKILPVEPDSYKKTNHVSVSMQRLWKGEIDLKSFADNVANLWQTR